MVERHAICYCSYISNLEKFTIALHVFVKNSIHSADIFRIYLYQNWLHFTYRNRLQFGIFENDCLDEDQVPYRECHNNKWFLFFHSGFYDWNAPTNLYIFLENVEKYTGRSRSIDILYYCRTNILVFDIWQLIFGILSFLRISIYFTTK